MNRIRAHRMVLLLAALLAAPNCGALGPGVEHASRCVVKVYGAGGVLGLEGYQSGLLVSPRGDVLTVDSVALEQGDALVVLPDGSRYTGVLHSVDPMTGAALLRLSIDNLEAPCFDLSSDVMSTPPPGAVVFALSNAFNIAAGSEGVSIQRGVLSGKLRLAEVFAASDRFAHGEAVLSDAVTSNPGAAGGALVAVDGSLVGMIGPETLSPHTGTWLNYAISRQTLGEAMRRMESGADQQPSTPESLSIGAERDLLDMLGIALVPALGPRTPPYVEYVEPEGRANAAGLRADDLIVAVGPTQSTGAAQASTDILNTWREGDGLCLTVLRGGQLVVVEVSADESEDW